MNGTSSGHFVWIHSFSRLIFRETRHKAQKWLCKQCIHPFSSKAILDRHRCTYVSGQRTVLPKCRRCDFYIPSCVECQDAKILKFRDYGKRLRIPVVIIADFEAFLSPSTEAESLSEVEEEENEGERTRTAIEPPKRVLTSQHRPAAVAFKVCFDEELESLPQLECVPRRVQLEIAESMENDLSKNFLLTVYKIGLTIKKALVSVEGKGGGTPCPRTPEIEDAMKGATSCFICEKNFKPEEAKALDHSHFTGKFRGAAHVQCNLAYNLSRAKIPCVFHNLRNYDMKFLIQDLGKLPKFIGEEINVIGDSSEKFKTLRVGDIQFIDSYQHLPSSLDSLSRDLLHECWTQAETGATIELERARKMFPHLSNEFPNDEQFRLLLRKGVFPYTHLSHPRRMSESALPPIEAFYNDLQQAACSEKDYTHAQNVWQVFRMTSLKEYLELYLTTDVLLLADIIENYRVLSLADYKLDPLQFITGASFFYQSALFKTQAEVELITDIDMFQFLSRGIRGGVSFVGHRYGKTDTNHQLTTLDFVNLYGYSMRTSLPLGGWQWEEGCDDESGMRQNGFTRALELANRFPTVQEALGWIDQQPRNFFLEADAHFPPSIHDQQNGFPFLPEHLKPPGGTCVKLVSHLGDRERYVLSFEMFLLAKANGIVFRKIHRVLSFNQSPWLREYIDLNVKKRAAAISPFQRAFFKAANNLVYGKTLQDSRKHRSFELFTEAKMMKFRKIHLRTPYLIQNEVVYRRCGVHEKNPDSVFCDATNSCVLCMEKTRCTVQLKEPIFLGFKVLESSKCKMYEFYYHVLVPHFADKIQLLATDTDSFILSLQTDDLTKDFYQLREHFDFSNFPPSHPLYSTKNKAVPGFMKVEYGPRVMEEFCGLRSKLYGIRFRREEEEEEVAVKKAKGVKRSVVEKEVSFQDYLDCLVSPSKKICRTQTQILSLRQRLYTVKQNKVALSGQDDKRYLLPDQISTLAWGHKRIPLT